MSKNKSVTRRHHYVPRGYLKGFAKDRIQIHAKPLDKNDKEFKAGVGHVALEYEYNTLKSPAIFERIDEAEGQLGAIENKAIPIIRGIENHDWRLDLEKRNILSFYIALQATRVPRIRAMHEEFLNYLEERRDEIEGPDHLKIIAQSFEHLNYPDFDANIVWQSLSDKNLSLKDNLQLQHLQNTFISAERDFEFILIRPWKFVYFDDCALITSDSPISSYPPKKILTKENSTIGGVSGMLFPVSRRVALSIGDYPRVNPSMSVQSATSDFEIIRDNMDGKRDRSVKGNAVIARHYNSMTAHFAHKYLYCHPDDADFDAAELRNSFYI